MAPVRAGFPSSREPMTSASKGPPGPIESTSKGPEGRRSGDTRVFGLLGGIASGKSTVSEVLAGSEGVILSADQEAHAALEQPDIQERLIERFGPGVIGPDGKTDRPALGKVVFDDPEARKALEGWIHPVVRARLWAAFLAAIDQGCPAVVVDVPLLLESAPDFARRGSSSALPDELPSEPPPDGLLRYCDYLVFIDAPIAARDARAVKNRGWEPGEVRRREAAQMPLAEKRRHADLIIQNDQGPNELHTQVHAALSSLDSSSQ